MLRTFFEHFSDIFEQFLDRKKNRFGYFFRLLHAYVGEVARGCEFLLIIFDLELSYKYKLNSKDLTYLYTSMVRLLFLSVVRLVGWGVRGV